MTPASAWHDAPTVPMRIPAIPDKAPDVPAWRRISSLGVAGFVAGSGLVVLAYMAAIVASHGAVPALCVVVTAVATVLAAGTTATLVVRDYVARRSGAIEARIATLETQVRIAVVRIESAINAQTHSTREHIAAMRSDVATQLGGMPDRMTEYADGKVIDAGAAAAIADYRRQAATGTDGRWGARGVASVSRIRPAEPT